MQPTGHVPNLPSSRTENTARDAARAAIEDRSADPSVLALAAACRTLRHRGVTPEEVATLLAVSGKVADPNVHLAVRDFAYQVGDPAPEPEVVADVMPSIDLDDLFGGSPALVNMVRWVAGEVVCGPDLPALTILALASAACAVKVVGACGTWTNPPKLYLAAEVASGENKSRVRKACHVKMLQARARGPVTLWHADLGERLGGGAEGRALDLKIRLSDLERLKRSKGDPTLISDLEVEVFKLRRDLKAKTPPVPGWLQIGKVTPAQYMRDMEIGGFVACFPDEGKETLWAFVGESGKGDIAPLLCGFTGEAWGNSTIAAEQRGDLRRFADYHATVWLPLQLGVLTPTTPEDARMLATLADRGFLARFLIARPRAVTSAEAPLRRAEHVERWAGVDARTQVDGPYKTLLAALLNGEGQTAEDMDGIPERRAEEVLVGMPHPLVPARPWVFTYDDEAEAALLDYQTKTRDSAKAGGEHDEAMRAAFVGRLADHAHRLATLLAVLRSGGFEGGGTVTLADVQRAIRFLDGYALPHTLAVYERATFAPIVDDAETVLRHVRAVGEITKSALLSRLPLGGREWDKARGSDRLTRLEVALESLEARGRVTLLAVRKGSVLVRYVGQ